MDRIILGAALGIGAIVAAPFTGGGSVLGAATLASSLGGFGTGLEVATAGLVGAAVADGMADEEEISAYCEGYREAKKKYRTKWQKAEEKYGPLICVPVQNESTRELRIEALFHSLKQRTAE